MTANNYIWELKKSDIQKKIVQKKINERLMLLDIKHTKLE